MSDETPTETTITPSENGPYRVTGPVRILDADGTEYTTRGRTIALCRCGGSQTKPFCDGTHSKTGFQAAERAVREEEEAKEQGEQQDV